LQSLNYKGMTSTRDFQNRQCLKYSL